MKLLHTMIAAAIMTLGLMVLAPPILAAEPVGHIVTSDTITTDYLGAGVSASDSILLIADDSASVDRLPGASLRAGYELNLADLGHATLLGGAAGAEIA